MMFSIIWLIIISIIVLVVLQVLGVINSKQKNFTARTAPIGSRASRIAESAVLLCIAATIYIFTATNTSTNGMLLNLSHLTEPLKQIHIAAACIVLTLLIISALIIYFWRGGVGIVLAAIVMIVYGFFLNGDLMVKFFPDDIFAPKVEYTFQMSGKFTGGEELWINNVYMGKMPLTITWEEFREKVPFMTEPPEGYKDENSHQPAEPWCRFTFWTMKKRDDSRHFYYDTDSQDYFAKIKFNGQWAQTSGGSGGGGGGRWYRQYDCSFYGHFPDRDKLIEEENNRFNTLVHKARLSNYTVDSEWFNTFKTFDEERFWDLRILAKNEPGFEKVMDAIARFEYGIPETVDKQTAQKVFNQICTEADASMIYATGGIEGRAIELIYDQLDVNQLVSDCKKGLKSNRPLRVSASWRGDEYKDYKTYSHDVGTTSQRNKPLPASFSVVHHAICLWDKKLDAENPSKDNIVETELTPLYIASRGDVDAASQLGGTIFEEYLLRQFSREHRLEGMDIDYESREYVSGLHLNKWIYHLVQLDTPAGREFRRRNSDITEKMARLLTDSMHNHSKNPPDFVFNDLGQGQYSLAVRFWPEYSASIENSSPPWEESKLEKRFTYLSRMGALATAEMYIDCWKRVDLDEIHNTGQIIQSIRMIPRQRQLLLAQYILNDLKKRKDQISFNQDWFILEFENYLTCLGDESSMQAFLSLEPKQKQDRLRQIKNTINNYIFKYDRGDVSAFFVAQGDADLKILTVEYLRETPIPENVALLTQLKQDMDTSVQQATERALHELKAIEQTPYEKLASLERTYVAPQ